MKKWLLYPTAVSREDFLEFINRHGLRKMEFCILSVEKNFHGTAIEFAYFAEEELK